MLFKSNVMLPNQVSSLSSQKKMRPCGQMGICRLTDVAEETNGTPVSD